MATRKRSEYEVMEAQVRRLLKKQDAVIAELNAVMAGDLKPGIAPGLYDMRMSANSGRVWLLGLLDSMKQMR
jgi:hypothetical protein